MWLGGADVEYASEPLAPGVATTKSRSATHEAERRQLTVMFCDLVGSTELSTRMDPEDLRDLITAFQDTCGDAIQRYDGFIARYMGDGMLVCFGYPQPHEDDAERAARAGLVIVGEMPVLNSAIANAHKAEVSVRIGIATGAVIVGDFIGEGAAEEAAVVGETPNLAARLQGLAEPNQVVVSGATRRMLGALFDCGDLGSHELKGIAQPTQAWRVITERDTESRFAATRASTSSELIGRNEEAGLLSRAWEGARQGHGQAVLIQGEAGLGKSRLVDSLRNVAGVRGEDYEWIPLRSSPYHEASSLHPVIEHLKRAMHWQADDSEHVRLRKLEEALDGFESVPTQSVALLSLPLPEDNGLPLDFSAEAQREMTLDALTSWLMEAAERKPGVRHCDGARTGIVTYIHRFGSKLNLNVHLHVLALDAPRCGCAIRCWRLGRAALELSHLQPLSMDSRSTARLAVRLTNGPS